MDGEALVTRRRKKALNTWAEQYLETPLRIMCAGRDVITPSRGIDQCIYMDYIQMALEFKISATAYVKCIDLGRRS